MRIHFVLISEGPTDDSLIPHIADLCVKAGADEATGTAPDLSRLSPPVGHSLMEKIPVVLALEPDADIYIIHRDADSPDPTQRHQEIGRVVATCGMLRQWCPLVPVQETEAWILLDERAIRVVAGRPNGRIALDLPLPRNLERLARPKEHLEAVLLTASESTGRRLYRFRKTLSSQRKRLLQMLPVGGPLLQVPAWVKFRDSVSAAVQQLQEAKQGDP